jgi:hypothetical protein
MAAKAISPMIRVLLITEVHSAAVAGDDKPVG